MDTLVEKLEAYGADVTGAMERFMDDAELYAECLTTFSEDKNFTKLSTSLEDQAYPQAFDAAHALKGVAGNLGLTPLFTAICDMVESLRQHHYEDDLQAKCEKILSLLSQLKDILNTQSA